MKYLHKFTSTDDFNAAYNGTDYLEPWVSITPLSYKWMLNNSEFTVELIEKNKEVSFDDPTEPNFSFVMRDCFIWKDTVTNDLYATKALPESGIPVVRVTATPEDSYPYNSGNVSLNGRNTMTTLFLSSSEQIFKVDYNK